MEEGFSESFGPASNNIHDMKQVSDSFVLLVHDARVSPYIFTIYKTKHEDYSAV